MIINTELIRTIEERVKKRFESDTSGHDYFHIQRVVKLSKHIAKSEHADVMKCEIIAWLHEMDDYKLIEGSGHARRLIEELGLPKQEVQFFEGACDEISFKGNGVNSKPSSLEAQVVQDADRLDAIGAIGLARTFAYGGKKGQAIFDPDLKAQFFDSFEKYKNAKTSTINHFHEKLLLLKDLMNTKEGKRIAEERHAYLLDYLDRFILEWEGKDF
ncbi:MAG: HD domain-containing protein [Bacteroidota bacterium]